MAATPTPTRRTVRLENLHRDKVMVPVLGGVPEPENGGPLLFVLGDKRDTDDNVPAGMTRDPARQPSPVRDITPEQWEAFGPQAREVIDGFVTANRIRRTELAA